MTQRPTPRASHASIPSSGEGRVEVSAPGKTILMGEHAAVYGHPALVTAIDRRLRVVLEPSETHGLCLDLPQVGVCQECAWHEMLDYARRAAEAWQDYRSAPSPEAFRRVRGDDPAHLIKVAVGEALGFLPTAGQALAEEQGLAREQGPTPGLRLHLHSEIPLGAGFGSSAAASVAVVVALLAYHGQEPDFETLHRLTLDVERRQHGSPSGIDNATVLHGGLVWAEPDADGKLVCEPLPSSAPWLSKVRIFNSGCPGQSTGDVVAAVRRLRQQDRRRFDDAMSAMVTATRELHQSMLDTSLLDDGLLGPGPDRDATTVVSLLRRFQGGLEALGVVPQEIRRIVRQVEEAGGAAKISGAGALEGPGAGSLLVFHAEPEAIDTWRFLDPLERLRTTLGAPGVRRIGASRNDRV